MSVAAPTSGDGILVTWRESPLASKAMLAGIVVNRLGAFIQVFLVLFLTHRGFSEVQAGTALGIYTTGAVLGVLLGGSMTDRLGARATILVSMVGSAVLILSILYLSNYPALVAAVFVVGLVGGAYRPASTALLSELTPPHRQVMIFAMYRLAYNVGSAAAPVVAVLLIAVSYDLLFWGEAVAALGYAAIAALLLPRRRTAEQAAADATAAKAAAEAAGEPDNGTGYRAVFRDYRYVLFMVAMVVNAAVYVQYLSTLPVAMRDAGLSTAWYGAMVTLNGVIVIGCELLMTKLTQRWPMRLVVSAGFVLLGGGLACYALPFGAAVFVVGTLIWTLAEIIAGPAMFAYPAIAGPSRLRGRYLAAGTAAFGVGSAAGSLSGLAVYSLVGEWVWVWCAVACGVGLGAAWLGMRVSAIKAAAAGRDTPTDTPTATADEPAEVPAEVPSAAPADDSVAGSETPAVTSVAAPEPVPAPAGTAPSGEDSR
jgi:MFS family permease